MRAVWGIVSKTDNFCHIITLPCIPHCFQLLVKDILELRPFALLISEAVEIVSFFCHSPLCLARLREIQVTNYGEEIALNRPTIVR